MLAMLGITLCLRTKKLAYLGGCLSALLIAACQPQAAPPPTLMMLPTLPPSVEPSVVVPTEVVIVPTATERPVSVMYAVGDKLIPV